MLFLCCRSFRTFPTMGWPVGERLNILTGMCALIGIDCLYCRRCGLHNHDGEVCDAAALPVAVSVSVSHLAHDARDRIGCAQAGLPFLMIQRFGVRACDFLRRGASSSESRI